MKSNEKAELLKQTISHLYSNEGRSISYISKLLQINRKTISGKIKEWSLPEPKPMRHLTPSNQKFLNKNRNLIKSRLDNNVSINTIADELKISRHTLYKTFILYDNVLKKAHDDYTNRIKTNALNRREQYKNNSRFDYDITPIPGEIWKPILGYETYEVSNKGRIRHYIKSYKSYMLIKQQPNKNNGRLYVTLIQNKKPKNLNVSRLVAHTFVNGFSEENNTVNHIDGNITNNTQENLEWVSQAQNNLHAYRKLNRNTVKTKRYNFQKIIYKEKYEFKTVAAFARFLGKSETQTRRYLDNPAKHQIKLINNCND
ncbi:MAG: NUMOD4 domain-containing protein [Ruminococcus bromii]|nr:NUMOD4 domain-containing protein [Ruminococcus bromii]